MKTTLVVIAVLAIGLLVLGGCAQSTTGAGPSGPPVPTSGGGCGIAAPAELGDMASESDSSSEL